MALICFSLVNRLVVQTVRLKLIRAHVKFDVLHWYDSSTCLIFLALMIFFKCLYHVITLGPRRFRLRSLSSHTTLVSLTQFDNLILCDIDIQIEPLAHMPVKGI